MMPALFSVCFFAYSSAFSILTENNFCFSSCAALSSPLNIFSIYTLQQVAILTVYNIFPVMLLFSPSVDKEFSHKTPFYSNIPSSASAARDITRFFRVTIQISRSGSSLSNSR